MHIIWSFKLIYSCIAVSQLKNIKIKDPFYNPNSSKSNKTLMFLIFIFSYSFTSVETRLICEFFSIDMYKYMMLKKNKLEMLNT